MVVFVVCVCVLCFRDIYVVVFWSSVSSVPV